MSTNVYFHEFLNTKYLEMKSRNTAFSVRAFAKSLDLQPSATNEILKGQRQVSKKMAEKIAEKLKLDPTERSNLLSGFNDENRSAPASVETIKKSRRIKEDEFKFISDWVHFAILSLINVEDFSSDIDWIAGRLGVSALEIRKALLRLQHLDLIHIAEKGMITRTSVSIRTSDDILNESLQEMHLRDMEIAATKIKEVPVHLRDFSNLTFYGSEKNLPRAKEIIRNAQNQLEALMESGGGKEVYRLCTYLFPLTVPGNKDEK